MIELLCEKLYLAFGSLDAAKLAREVENAVESGSDQMWRSMYRLRGYPEVFVRSTLSIKELKNA